MKTFGLMAAIGKIELDNFREKTTMGKRGSAKRGRVPAGTPPYGYRTGEDGKLKIYEPEGEVVRRVFHMYVHENMTGTAIVRQLTRDNASLSASNATGSLPAAPPTAPTSNAMASATGRTGSLLYATITATEC